MAEYISKQAFKEKYLCCGWLPEMSEEEFNSFPAADVVEVRHGRWESNGPDDIVVYCSQCMMPQDAPSKYCPSCGCRMDAKEPAHD